MIIALTPSQMLVVVAANVLLYVLGYLIGWVPGIVLTVAIISAIVGTVGLLHTWDVMSNGQVAIMIAVPAFPAFMMIGAALKGLGIIEKSGFEPKVEPVQVAEEWFYPERIAPTRSIAPIRAGASSNVSAASTGLRTRRRVPVATSRPTALVVAIES